MLSLIAFGAYQRQLTESKNTITVRIGASMAAGMIMLGVTFYIFPSVLISRGALVLSVFVSFVAIMAIRLLFYRLSDTYDLRMKVLVLGAGNASRLIREVDNKGEIDRINIISYMPMPGDLDAAKVITLAPGALTQFVYSKDIDQIVLAMDDRRNGFRSTSCWIAK